MNWKEFKTWLDKNIVAAEGLQVKIKHTNQVEYGNLSVITLTNFCDSLEATLDNRTDCHLFPGFQANKSFAELFPQASTYFGKKTNQQQITSNDYNLLKKLFEEYKKNNIEINRENNNTRINTNTMNDVRNILLIGRTGGGKSTLGNVLINKNNNFEETFKESSSSFSVTKDIAEQLVEIDVSRDGSEKIKYRIIDTIGIGDTNLTPIGVLTRLAEMGGRVKREGLNHILFVTQGRFTKEEIEAYDLLSSVIFDRDVLRYTTIVRTNFPNFENGEACADDRSRLRIENAELAHILGSVNVVYVDNPPLEGRQRVIEMNKETREESRKRLLTYLGTCQGNYRPSNIDTLNERVQDYKTNEQKLKDKMKELEESRKKQEEEFRKKISELKEEQAKELRENRIKFEEDIRKVKVEGDENLRKTKTELEEKRQRDMNDLENRNRQQISNLQDSHRREAESIRAAGEQQMKTIQSQMQRSQEETEKLRKELSEKGNSSMTEMMTMMMQIRADDQRRAEQREETEKEYRREQAKADREAQQRSENLRWELQEKADEREAQRRKDEAAARKEYQTTINSLAQQLNIQKEENENLRNENQEQATELDEQKEATEQAQQRASDYYGRLHFWQK